MSVLLITASERRHLYFATRAAARVDVCGIVCEQKAPAFSSNLEEAPDDAAVIARHFTERDEAESRLLGDPHPLDEGLMLRIPTGSLNDSRVCNWIEKREPDLLLLYGTGLLKAPILDVFSGRIVNLHLGLSPYYRGAGTNFWPLVIGEPECVGATIHLAVAKVDAGPVYAQVRPDIEAGDRAHEVGTKAIIAGIAALLDIAEAWSGSIAGREQDLSTGRVFRQRDFHAAAVRQMWRNLDNGMLRDYLSARTERDARFPIHSFAPESVRAGAA